MRASDMLLVMVFLLCGNADPVEFTRYFPVHPGKKYGNITLEVKKSIAATCSIYCTNQGRDACYGFNYRQTDSSCQLVMHGNGTLVDAQGYESYVQSEFKVSPFSNFLGFQM